ncbi:MAG: M50 family metallopeptidase [Bacteroidota bacterium]
MVLLSSIHGIIDSILSTVLFFGGIASVFLSMIVLILVVHEAGHRFFGWIFGWELLWMSASYFLVQRFDKGLLLRINTDLPLTGGFTSQRPKKQDNLAKEYVLMVAGGPIFSLIFGAALLWFAGLRSSSAYSILGFSYGGLSGLFSILVGLSNLIPFTSRSGHRSDGAKIIAWLRKDRDFFVDQAYLVIQTNLDAGKRFRDLPQEVVEAVQVEKEQIVNSQAGSFILYQYQLDTGDIAAAKQSLDNILQAEATFESGSEPEIFAEAAFFYAYFEKNLPKAKQYQKKADSLGQEFPTIRHMLADAAVYQLEGKFEQAICLAAIALKVPKLSPSQQEFFIGIYDQASLNAQLPKPEWQKVPLAGSLIRSKQLYRKAFLRKALYTAKKLKRWGIVLLGLSLLHFIFHLPDSFVYALLIGASIWILTALSRWSNARLIARQTVQSITEVENGSISWNEQQIIFQEEEKWLVVNMDEIEFWETHRDYIFFQTNFLVFLIMRESLTDQKTFAVLTEWVEKYFPWEEEMAKKKEMKAADA